MSEQLPPELSPERLATVPAWNPEIEELEPPRLDDCKHIWFDNDADAPHWYCFAPDENGVDILWKWVDYRDFPIPARWVPWTTMHHPATAELLRLVTQEPIEVQAARAVEWFNSQQDRSSGCFLVIDRESDAWSLYQAYSYGSWAGKTSTDSACIWDALTDAMVVAYCKGIGWDSTLRKQ